MHFLSSKFDERFSSRIRLRTVNIAGGRGFVNFEDFQSIIYSEEIRQIWAFGHFDVFVTRTLDRYSEKKGEGPAFKT